jgi:hypothetical protein
MQPGHKQISTSLAWQELHIAAIYLLCTLAINPVAQSPSTTRGTDSIHKSFSLQGLLQKADRLGGLGGTERKSNWKRLIRVKHTYNHKQRQLQLVHVEGAIYDD